jgi:hypothetical protein
MIKEMSVIQRHPPLNPEQKPEGEMLRHIIKPRHDTG